MRLQVLLVLIIISGLSTNSFAQDLSWIHQSEGYLVPLHMEKTDDHRIFISGYVYKESKYEGTTIETKGLDDVFLGEVSNNGSLIWHITFGSAFHDDRPSKLLIDHDHNRILLSGIIGQTGTIESDTCNLEYSNGFVAAFDFDGNYLWSNFQGGTDHDYISDIALDENGDVLLVGDVYGEVQFTTNTIGTENTSTSYIGKLNDQGQEIWIKPFNGFLQYPHISSISSNLFTLAGSYHGSISLDSISFNSALQNQENILLFGIDNNGMIQWSQEMKGAGRNYARNVLAHKDQVLIIGQCSQYEAIETQGTILNNANNFMMRLEPNGNLISLKNFAQGFFSNNSVHITKDDELILSGSYTYEAAINDQDLPTEFSQEGYVIHLNNDEQIDWYKTFNGNLNDIPVAAVQGESDNILVLGYFGADMMIEDTIINSPNFDLNLFLSSFKNDIFSEVHQANPAESSCKVYSYHSSVHINFSDQSWLKSNVVIFNNLGQIVYQQSLSSKKNVLHTDLLAGSYHYMIINENGRLESGTFILN